MADQPATLDLLLRERFDREVAELVETLSPEECEWSPIGDNHLAVRSWLKESGFGLRRDVYAVVREAWRIATMSELEWAADQFNERGTANVYEGKHNGTVYARPFLQLQFASEADGKRFRAALDGAGRLIRVHTPSMQRLKSPPMWRWSSTRRDDVESVLEALVPLLRDDKKRATAEKVVVFLRERQGKSMRVGPGGPARRYRKSKSLDRTRPA